MLHAVNNFQNITEELTLKQENMEQNEEVARMKEELTMELTMHDSKMANARYRMRPMVPILCVFAMHRKSIFVPKASSGHSAGSCSTNERSVTIHIVIIRR